MNDIKCSRCGAYKPPTAFPANASKASGRSRECRRCRELREKTPDAREAKRYRAILKNYGLTPEAYGDLVLQQAGLCAICHQPETKLNDYGERVPLAIDHDHKTNKVRGLLCSNHNKALGLFGDDPELLREAAAYLRRHE